MSTVIKRLTMLILMEHDLKAAIDFYEMFGLELVFHLPKQWAEFDVHGIKLGLCPTTTSRIENNRTGFVFEVENLRTLYESLKDTHTFLSEPVEKLHGLMVSIVDPGGNIIDLYQPTHERIQSLINETQETQ